MIKVIFEDTKKPSERALKRQGVKNLIHLYYTALNTGAQIEIGRSI